MKVKIPVTIKVGSFTFRIEHLPNLHRDFDSYGRVSSNRALIELDLDMPDHIKCVSFLHEVIHAIDDCSSLHLHDDDVDRLAHGMTQILRDSLGIEFDFREIRGGVNGKT